MDVVSVDILGSWNICLSPKSFSFGEEEHPGCANDTPGNCPLLPERDRDRSRIGTFMADSGRKLLVDLDRGRWPCICCYRVAGSQFHLLPGC